MNRVVVLGEPERTRGYRLAGATVIEAATAAEVERAWSGLPADTMLLVLTRDAVAVVANRLAERPRLIWAVLSS